ncbi:MAG TPA: IS30 family transposase [Candidatus Limicola stercorigallinarum]|nr:IS30 family transposase [Candidatus Limicola stercorigallinarum]
MLEGRWSPEQIEGRIALERPDLAVSDTTIYREIRSGRLDRCIGGRKASARLRRAGRRRKRRDGSELRGKIKVSHELSERPAKAEGRSRIGDWEGDTVADRCGGACLVTMVDRMSGLIAGGKPPSKRKGPVRRVMEASMEGRPCETVTLDRGKEFAEHALFTKAVGAECYFCLPHHPWQRGTNENTNGLLRQYFPKSCDLDSVDDAEVRRVYDELNRRPRERLGWRTPYEVYHSTVLHLL